MFFTGMMLIDSEWLDSCFLLKVATCFISMFPLPKDSIEIDLALSKVLPPISMVVVIYLRPTDSLVMVSGELPTVPPLSLLVSSIFSGFCSMGERRELREFLLRVAIEAKAAS